MRGTYTFKYRGILKNFNIEKINRDTFPQLIAANIFDVDELSDRHVSSDFYLAMEVDDLNWGLSNYYEYYNKSYCLKHEIVVAMFDDCKSKCESQDELQYKILEIDLNINIQASDYSKIKFLKTEIFIMNQNMSDPHYYLLYSKKRETEGYSSWFEYFRSEQIDNEDYTFIFKYLKGDRDFVPTFIKQIWQDYFIIKHLTEYCKKKIQIIESNTGINEVDVFIDSGMISVKLNSPYDTVNKETITEYKDIRTDIFKDENSRKLFDFIIENWKGKKNTSFYSMLYKYLQNKEMIIIPDKDSSSYRSLIVDKYDLKAFAKVQQQTTNKENNKWDKVFDTFKDIEKKFTL